MFGHLFVPVDVAELPDEWMAEVVALAKQRNARITAGVSDPLGSMPTTAYQADVLALCISARPDHYLTRRTNHLPRLEHLAREAGVEVSVVSLPFNWDRDEFWDMAMRMGCDFAVLPPSLEKVNVTSNEAWASLALI